MLLHFFWVRGGNCFVITLQYLYVMSLIVAFHKLDRDRIGKGEMREGKQVPAATTTQSYDRHRVQAGT